ncbi:MAG: hypothetical protein NTU41_01985 [Chloroflexi bacterium]|nr:hypothetical protein [Chloroflexota bacterium]
MTWHKPKYTIWQVLYNILYWACNAGGRCYGSRGNMRGAMFELMERRKSGVDQYLVAPVHVMVNVTPAEAGVQKGSLATEGLDEGKDMRLWIPACAGMTRRVTLIYATKYKEQAPGR